MKLLRCNRKKGGHFGPPSWGVELFDDVIVAGFGFGGKEDVFAVEGMGIEFDVHDGFAAVFAGERRANFGEVGFVVFACGGDTNIVIFMGHRKVLPCFDGKWKSLGESRGVTLKIVFRAELALAKGNF